MLLTIAIQLFCFKIYCQNNTIKIRDIIINSDTTCIVPTKLLKTANVKLIERESFYNIMTQQDSMINLYERQVDQYYCITTDLQDRIISKDNLTEDLRKSIERKQKTNKIFIGTTCGFLATTILVLLIK